MRLYHTLTRLFVFYPMTAFLLVAAYYSVSFLWKFHWIISTFGIIVGLECLFLAFLTFGASFWDEDNRNDAPVIPEELRAGIFPDHREFEKWERRVEKQWAKKQPTI